MSAVEDRLSELGLTVPEVVPPVAAYVPVVREGDLVFTSGQLPMVDGALAATGKVGAEVDAETAKALAETCALNAIAAIKSEIGDLDTVSRVVKVVGFVASRPELHRPARRHQRRERAARQGLRRQGDPRPFGRRRRCAAVGRTRRGRGHRLRRGD